MTFDEIALIDKAARGLRDRIKGLASNQDALTKLIERPPDGLCLILDRARTEYDRQQELHWHETARTEMLAVCHEAMPRLLELARMRLAVKERAAREELALVEAQLATFFLIPERVTP